MSAKTTFKDLTPLKTFAKASKSCAAQVGPLFYKTGNGEGPWWRQHLGQKADTWGLGADKQSLAYGQCIGKSYQEVQKGMCENEFKAFKECVQVSRPISYPMQRRCVARDDDSGTREMLISEIIRTEMVGPKINSCTISSYHHA